MPLMPRAVMRFVARRFTASQCNALDALVVPPVRCSRRCEDYGVRCPMHIIPTGMEMERFAGGDGARFRDAARHRAGAAVAGARRAHRAREEHRVPVSDVCAGRARKPDVVLVVAGEGPALPALQGVRPARSGSTDHVRFVGYLSRDRELLDCYRAGDVFVFSSRTETQGLVLLEAMALGTPVVSTAHMGTADIVNPQRGAQVAPDDEAEFANIVLRAPGRSVAARRHVGGGTSVRSDLVGRCDGRPASRPLLRRPRPGSEELARIPARIDPVYPRDAVTGHVTGRLLMRWEGRRGSQNVEDRRGMRFGKAGGIGIGTILLALVAAYFGADPSVVLQGVQPSSQQAEQGPYQESPEEAQLREFVTVVLADTEDAWGTIFSAAGRTYEQPSLVLFSGAVQSACGFAQAAVGPFYCPGDRKVYIDLSFYQDLQSRFGAPGDFAQAYVVAHEVGHHVQTLLGISERNMAARQSASEAEANALSVRQELQADCFAGIWAHNADRSRQLLETGDIEEGLNAAAAIGDDRLQRQSGGYISPESFTHGSSEQRVSWFKRGFESGDVGSCDTFAARSL